MIYAISDLHLSLRGDKPMDVFGGNWHGYVETIKANWKQTVTKDDIVLLAGDTSWAINLEDAIDDVTDFFSDLEGNKVIIRGNHDYWWNSYAKLSAALPQGVYALQNNCIRFGKDLVCGT
ncbi:MAG: metallophosphoesterase, partial [Clostridia bacterium]|nr:metallophosphoesterase [Clostridia bacterium]